MYYIVLETLPLFTAIAYAIAEYFKLIQHHKSVDCKSCDK